MSTYILSVFLFKAYTVNAHMNITQFHDFGDLFEFSKFTMTVWTLHGEAMGNVWTHSQIVQNQILGGK